MKSFVYPDPVKPGRYQLSESCSWEVYSERLWTIKKGAGEIIDLSDEPAGVYMLKINCHTIGYLVV